MGFSGLGSGFGSGSVLIHGLMWAVGCILWWLCLGFGFGQWFLVYWWCWWFGFGVRFLGLFGLRGFLWVMGAFVVSFLGFLDTVVGLGLGCLLQGFGFGVLWIWAVVVCRWFGCGVLWWCWVASGPVFQSGLVLVQFQWFSASQIIWQLGSVPFLHPGLSSGVWVLWDGIVVLW